MIVYTLIPLVFDMEPEVCNNPTKGEPKPTCSTPKDWRGTQSTIRIEIINLCFAKKLLLLSFNAYSSTIFTRFRRRSNLFVAHVQTYGIFLISS